MPSRPRAPARWHRFLDHTGEATLQVRGESLAGLMAEAGRALGLLLLGAETAPVPSAPRMVEIHSRDRDALLVDFLNELLFLAETELWVPIEVEILDLTETRLRAQVGGVEVDQAPALVKAATLHGVRIHPHGDGLEAEVVLDL